MRKEVLRGDLGWKIGRRHSGRKDQNNNKGGCSH